MEEEKHCFNCKYYDVKWIRESKSTYHICKVRLDDHRIIVDLKAHKCDRYLTNVELTN